jgi:hypothetical protein
VIVKGTVIKAVCKDDQLLDPPFVGLPVVKLRLGTESYSVRFAGTILKNQFGLFKASGAPQCTPPGSCCGGFGFHAFTTANAAGDCGDVIDFSGNPGSPNPDLLCSGLYFGGGVNSVPLPLTFPGQEQTVTALTSCTGQSATLGATTSTDTTSNRNCSAIGCLFGPPVPLPQRPYHTDQRLRPLLRFGCRLRHAGLRHRCAEPQPPLGFARVPDW